MWKPLFKRPFPFFCDATELQASKYSRLNDLLHVSTMMDKYARFKLTSIANSKSQSSRRHVYRKVWFVLSLLKWRIQVFRLLSQGFLLLLNSILHRNENKLWGRQITLNGPTDPLLSQCKTHTICISHMLISKLSANHVLFSLQGGDKLHTCVLRPPGIYGPEEQRHLPRVAVCVT